MRCRRRFPSTCKSALRRRGRDGRPAIRSSRGTWNDPRPRRSRRSLSKWWSSLHQRLRPGVGHANLGVLAEIARQRGGAALLRAGHDKVDLPCRRGKAAVTALVAQAAAAGTGLVATDAAHGAAPGETPPVTPRWPTVTCANRRDPSPACPRAPRCRRQTFCAGNRAPPALIGFS